MPKLPWGWLIAALVAFLVVGGTLATCAAPDPVATPRPPAPILGPAPLPSAATTPVASPPAAVAEVKQTARIVIKRNRPATSGEATSPDASPGVAAAPEDETIEVFLDQSAIATAPIVTPPPATPAPITVTIDPEISDVIRHARFGVMLATVPGVVAGDIQVLRGKPLKAIDRWGVLPEATHEMEMSLDVEANLAQAGFMAATGGKWFFGAGMYGGYAGGSGIFVGSGLRF